LGSTAQTAPRGTTSPLGALAVGQQLAQGPGVEIDLVPPTGLTLAETWDRFNDTQVALRVTVLQKQADDRTLAGARLAVEDLRDETRDIAQSTVDNAISNYRNLDVDQGLLEAEDLNAGLRANALGDAALVADTSTFDRYRETAKDLQLAEYNLAAEVVENDRLSSEVVALQARLEVEQSWLADYEERDLHRRTHGEWTTESIWSQQLGTKQGFYLRTCPIKGPHQFIDSWGFARSGGRRHKGVDLLAKTGTPIVAPVDGVVSYRSNSVGGRSFHLTDEFGNYYYGTHMSGYGDVDGEVRAGQVIGYVGDDGNAAGIPHLHFEIHPGGRSNPINPFTDSAAVCDGAQ
jgi:murein DD-endopeptidase MepM/ murein hydrolase activator NlpD